MPSKRFRSRTFRRVYKKLPGGLTKLRYERRKPKKAHCANCHVDLKGVIRDLNYKVRKASKTQRRPERPFAGMLCSKCSRSELKDGIRSLK